MKLRGFRINSELPMCCLKSRLNSCSKDRSASRLAGRSKGCFASHAIGRLKTAFAPALALFLTGVLTMAFPIQAFGIYANPSVTTVAQMQTNGSMRVSEQRDYSFSEKYSIITWPFTGLSSKQPVEIEAVRIILMDQEGNIVRDWSALESVPFQSAWRDLASETQGIAANVEAAAEAKGTPNNANSATADTSATAATADTADDVSIPAPGSYSFDERRNVLYVFPGDFESTTVIECDYVINNAALVYDDTAELYWDYAPSRQGVNTKNLDVQIQMPVPEGAVVTPGENLRAWGHGPEGTVEVRSDGTVAYFVPELRDGQYAQAHVLFPREWLTNITVQSKLAKSGTRFDDAVAEEETWTDTYTSGVVNALTMDIALLVLCVIALVGAAVAYAAFGRERKPYDTDISPDGFDDAVIGRLLRWNHVSSSDFVATIRQLARIGVVQIATTGDQKMRIRVTPTAKSAQLTPVQREAMKVVFDVVGQGYQSVSLADVLEFRERHPKKMEEAMESWQSTLTKEVDTAALFDKRSYKAAAWTAAVAGVLAVCGVAEWAAGGNTIMGVLMLASAVAVAAIAYCMPRRTPEGVAVEEAVQARKMDACKTPESKAGEDKAPASETPETKTAKCESDKEPEWELLEKATSF